MIRTDSRKVKPGDTFVAIDGISSNGSDYIYDAIDNGAKYIVCAPDRFEHYELARAGRLKNVINMGIPKYEDALKVENDDRVTVIYTYHPRQYMEKSLRNHYKNLIDDMTIIAVTGTNGKTTTCWLVDQALTALGEKCAYIGTIGFYIGKEKIKPLPNTSVDICSLYELLQYAYDRGVRYAAIEASSQGLDMGRLNTIRLDAAVFTNLTEDHLDWHGTMEKYAAAKKKLFKMLKEDGAALINTDDSAAAEFMLEGNKNYTYGTGDCDFKIAGMPGSDPENKESFAYMSEGKLCKTTTKLAGVYNMYNLTAAAGVLRILGFSDEKICGVIPELEAPEGRCEVIPSGTNRIIIDYAHTPDAMDKIISSAASMTDGNIYVVFGCTGDREREKRPVMTKTALSRCKYAILTQDDIHSETFEQIIADMLEGNELTNYEICEDRREAIKTGMALLEDNDILLILGKGHEQFMIAGNEKIPFNDKETVTELIRG